MKVLFLSITEIVRHVCISGTGNCLSATLLRGGNFRFVAYILIFFLYLFIKDTVVNLNGSRKIITRGNWEIKHFDIYLLYTFFVIILIIALLVCVVLY